VYCCFGPIKNRSPEVWQRLWYSSELRKSLV
jgi:hypothetical protein